MNTTQAPATPLSARVQLAHTMFDDVLALAKAARSVYRQNDEAINKNLAAGESRMYGKRKLKLSYDHLSQHVEAVDARRKATRELQILVPTLRALNYGLQNRDSFDTESSLLLMGLARRFTRLYSQWSPQTYSYEAAVAVALLTRHRELFGKLLPGYAVLTAPPHDNPERKLRALYAKICDIKKHGLTLEELAVIRKSLCG